MIAGAGYRPGGSADEGRQRTTQRSAAHGTGIGDADGRAAALSLDRTTLLLAAGVWSAFFLIHSTLLLYAPGAVFDWGA